MSTEKDDIVWRAIEVFGNHDKAIHWLNSPFFELGGAFPAIMIGEAAGVELVLNTLEKIENGIPATAPLYRRGYENSF